jgi:hypothetical protein
MVLLSISGYFNTKQCLHKEQEYFTTNRAQVPGIGVPTNNTDFLTYINTYDPTGADIITKMNLFHNYGSQVSYVLIPISSIDTYSAILDQLHPML